MEITGRNKETTKTELLNSLSCLLKLSRQWVLYGASARPQMEHLFPVESVVND